MEPNSMIILGVVLMGIGLAILLGGWFLLSLWKRNMQNDLQQGQNQI